MLEVDKMSRFRNPYDREFEELSESRRESY